LSVAIHHNVRLGIALSFFDCERRYRLVSSGLIGRSDSLSNDNASLFFNIFGEALRIQINLNCLDAAREARKYHRNIPRDAELKGDLLVTKNVRMEEGLEGYGL